ncbi:MAG TPA: rhodanese-like domain-containing protein [Flavisolibacter sp.]
MKNPANNASYVDVRTPEEYNGGHYANAVNIPLDQVRDRIDEFKKMQKPIILYCQSGNRSSLAASILKQMGIRDVHNGGGLQDLLNN